MSLYEKMFNVMNDSEAIEKNMEVGTGKKRLQSSFGSDNTKYDKAII